jgi:hypothetical protein
MSPPDSIAKSLTAVENHLSPVAAIAIAIRGGHDSVVLHYRRGLYRAIRHLEDGTNQTHAASMPAEYERDCSGSARQVK